MSSSIWASLRCRAAVFCNNKGRIHRRMSGYPTRSGSSQSRRYACMHIVSCQRRPKPPESQAAYCWLCQACLARSHRHRMAPNHTFLSAEHCSHCPIPSWCLQSGRHPILHLFLLLLSASCLSLGSYDHLHPSNVRTRKLPATQLSPFLGNVEKYLFGIRNLLRCK